MKRDAIGSAQHARELGGLSALVIVLEMILDWAGLEMGPKQGAALGVVIVSLGSWGASLLRDRKCEHEQRGQGGPGGQGGAGQDGQDGMPGGQGGAGGVGGQGGQARVAVGVLALALLAACAAYDGPTYASLARAEIRAEAFGLDRCTAHQEAAEALRADGPTRTLWVTAGKSLQTLAADHEQYAVLCRRTAQLAASSRASDDQVERYMAKSRRTWRAGMEELGMEVTR